MSASQSLTPPLVYPSSTTG